MTTPPMEDIQKSSTLVWGVVPNIQLWNLVSSKKQVQSYEGQEEVYLTVLDPSIDLQSMEMWWAPFQKQYHIICLGQIMIIYDISSYAAFLN